VGVNGPIAIAARRIVATLACTSHAVAADATAIGLNANGASRPIGALDEMANLDH
jgi:hypothetical protein